MCADKYAAEPGSQIFAALKIVHAKGGSSKKLVIRMRNPCDRQLISIQVRLQFFDSSIRSSFAKNRVPLFKQPLPQLRDVFWMLNQIADPNAAHINSMLRLNETHDQLASTLKIERHIIGSLKQSGFAPSICQAILHKTTRPRIITTET